MKKILFALLLISFGASAQNKTIYLKVGAIDTSFVGTNYFNKTYITSNLGTKLNITDTAAMLAGYKTFYPRVAISLTTTGTSGAATYNNGTGVLNIPSYAGGTTTNALTMNNGGAGAASGTTFNGSVAQTISYNTIGAQPQLSGTGFVKATGTTISYDNSTYLTTTTAGTTYVPYTGATGAVNLGTNTLSAGTGNFTGILKAFATAGASSIQIVGRVTDNLGFIEFFNNDGITVNSSINGGTSGLSITGAATFSNLAGTGSRYVVADASGNLTATTTAITTTPSTTIFSKYGQTVVSNTTTLTQVAGTGVGSTTIGANVITLGKTYRIKVKILFTTVNSSARTLTISGGFLSASGVAIPLAATVTNGTVDCEFISVCTATGASGTFTTDYKLSIITARGGTPIVYSEAGLGTGFNTTASNSIGTTVQWSDANASNTCTINTMTIEQLN